MAARQGSAPADCAPPSVNPDRVTLGDRLRARQAEIERTVSARILSIESPGNTDDSFYVEGLRTAVAIAIEYSIQVVESSTETPPSIPVPLLAQTRVAARNGISLDVVLRRYFAGYSVLCDYLIEGAQEEGPGGVECIKRRLVAQATVFDRLIAAIGEEYARENQRRPATTEELRTRRVELLLRGDPSEEPDIGYSFDQWHLGLVATDPSVEGRMREVARQLDFRLLLVRRPDGVLWAWMGGRRRPDPVDLLRLVSSRGARQAPIALGEPGHGLNGWRLTHRQARAAAPIASRGEKKAVRYSDVALLAAVLRDDLLATSLRALYLTPLSTARGGASLRETLRTYIATGGNVSSAAAAMGIKRQTVTNRLRKAEELLEKPIDRCTAELDAALRLRELDATPWPKGSCSNGQIDPAKTLHPMQG